jgi:hypothetical protein
MNVPQGWVLGFAAAGDFFVVAGLVPLDFVAAFFVVAPVLAVCFLAPVVVVFVAGCCRGSAGSFWSSVDSASALSKISRLRPRPASMVTMATFSS